jgi:hypothetical protein
MWGMKMPILNVGISRVGVLFLTQTALPTETDPTNSMDRMLEGSQRHVDALENKLVSSTSRNCATIPRSFDT